MLFKPASHEAHHVPSGLHCAERRRPSISVVTPALPLSCLLGVPSRVVGGGYTERALRSSVGSFGLLLVVASIIGALRSGRVVGRANGISKRACQEAGFSPELDA